LFRSAVRRCGLYGGVRHLLKALDCDDVIAETTSSRNGDTAKPEPGIVQVALDWAGVDAVWDAHAAAGAGLPCIGLLSCGIAHTELQAFGASPTVDDPQDLLDHPDSTRIAELAPGRWLHSVGAQQQRYCPPEERKHRQRTGSRYESRGGSGHRDKDDDRHPG
jgi:hypothetical protein